MATQARLRANNNYVKHNVKKSNNIVLSKRQRDVCMGSVTREHGWLHSGAYCK